MTTYLGDGVYATDEANPGHVTLSTGTHELNNADNIIHLDQQVRDALGVFFTKSAYTPLKKEKDAIVASLPDHIKSKCSDYHATQLDIDNLSREEVIECMHALKVGRWTREESGVEGCVDYKSTIGRITIRLYAAGPPDSCRLVEEEYTIPASTGVRKRLICSKPSTIVDDSATPVSEVIEGKTNDSIPF